MATKLHHQNWTLFDSYISYLFGDMSVWRQVCLAYDKRLSVDLLVSAFKMTDK